MRNVQATCPLQLIKHWLAAQARFSVLGELDRWRCPEGSHTSVGVMANPRTTLYVGTCGNNTQLTQPSLPLKRNRS